MASRLRQERGQSLVEFAIVLPVLIAIILGIIYFGRYENFSNQETQMAEQAARQAAVDVDPGASSGTTLQNYVLQQASPELQNGSGDVSSHAVVYLYYPGTSTGAVGQPLRACVVSTVQLPFPLSGSIKIVQSAEMRVEVAATAAPPPNTNTGWATNAPPANTCPTT